LGRCRQRSTLEKGIKGEREKGRKGEREKGRKGERVIELEKIDERGAE
jgi:hypothetical protein